MSTYLDAHAHDAAAALGVHASITLRHHGATVRAASSSTRAAVCDQAEARSEDGPCVVAMSGLQVVLVPDVSTEARWPAWSQAARREGFASVVAVPAAANPVTAVALNLYLEADRAWSERDTTRALTHAKAIAADVHDRVTNGASSPVSPTADEAGDPRALAAVVDQAVGVLMHANGCDARGAHALLELVAARDGTDVTDVADALITAIGHRS